MILEQLFTDIAGLAQFVPGIDSQVRLSALDNHARTAHKRIVNIIGPAVCRHIVDQAAGELYDSLRMALANLTLAADAAFDVLRKRKAGIDVYRHEQEAIRRAYYENYYNAMDSLIALLDRSTGLGWQETRYCRLLERLRIKTAEDFDLLYGIDLSYLFFFRCIPIQLEVLEEQLSGYFDRAEGRPSVLPLLERALAKLVVSAALRRFDVLEFPPTIRNLFSESQLQRYGTQEQERLLALSADLKGQAELLLRDADLLLAGKEETDIETETSFNRPEDKIQLMP